jgi:hypothetical protein
MQDYGVARHLVDEYMMMEESTCPRINAPVLQNSGCFVSWRAKRCISRDALQHIHALGVEELFIWLAGAGQETYLHVHKYT